MKQRIRIDLGVDGAACSTEHDQGLSGLLQCLQEHTLGQRQEKIPLVACRIFVGSIALLAFDGGVKTDTGDDDIRGFSGFNGFRQTVMIALIVAVFGPQLVKVRARCIQHPSREAVLDALQKRDVTVGRSLIVAL